ncbi:MAG TPA: helix-turn-helix domain-containing protein [Capillimicrobium sp.]|nr:helix-turn-helix domain-containing protein [Capillimicrobium sp.]
MLVQRHESEQGRWEMACRDAAAALRPHVRGYVGYVEDSPGPFRRLATPSDEVHVILSFGPRMRVPHPVTSFVAAPHSHATVTEHDGRQHGLELRLTPLGARMLLGVPMGELADQVVELDALLGRDAGELIERVHDARTWAARFALLDALLARRLAEARQPPPEVEGAWWRLTRTRGATPVADLVRESGWSRRHFTARFRGEVGLGPKVFARVLRFDAAARELQRPGGRSLAEIALDCGYYDQAHLNRDFRAFAGVTPTQLLARRLPDGGGWTAG